MAVKPFVRTATLQQSQSIVDGEGRPVAWFVRLINDNNGNVVQAINQIAQLPEIQAALLALDAATQAAQNAADAASAAASNSMREQSLVTSYVVETGVLSAAIDSGDPTKATITVASHTRKYGDGTSVSVTGGTLTGLNLSTQYYVFYVDIARTGGAVTYQTTTDLNAAGQTGDRHLVGGYTTPDAAGDGSGGGTTRPPGIPSWKFPEESI